MEYVLKCPSCGNTNPKLMDKDFHGQYLICLNNIGDPKTNEIKCCMTPIKMLVKHVKYTSYCF